MNIIRRKAFYCLLVSFLLALLTAPAVLAQSDERIAAVEGRQPDSNNDLDKLTLAELLVSLKVPGVSIAVINNYKVEWARGYGLADVATGEPVTTRTLFQAASISKPVFTMGVMKAVQNGRISLDADVNKYLRDWKVPVSDFNSSTPVTPRSLLSHTSGADDGLGFPGYAPDTSLPTLPQIINGEKPANTKKVLFARHPYEAYKYSGGGMTIMQLAFMNALNKPFAELMDQLVLTPLGMKDSTYQQPVSEKFSKQTSRAHDSSGKPMDRKWHVYPEQAAAGLWTTPSDLALFLLEVQAALDGKGKVLTQASAKEMTRPTGVGPFAVGLVVDKKGEGWYFSHSGSNWGFQCDMASHLRKGYGIVVMTNGNNGGALIREIESRVARAYKWDSLDKPLRR